MENAVLRSQGLTKRYGSKLALDNLDLTLPEGKIIGLLGPNGSGKTTLIKMANGLITWDQGELLIGGSAPGKETKAIVSYLPERTYLADWMSVRQLLDFFCDFYGDFSEKPGIIALDIDKTFNCSYKIIIN